MHVVLSLSPGGTERMVIDMATRLHASVYTAVCCLDELGDWAHELIDQGISVNELGRKPGFRIALAYRIASEARRHRANVVHCHHYSPFSLAAYILPRPLVVYTEHGRLSDNPPSRKRRLANKLFAKTPGRFVSVSENLREHMIAEEFPGDRVSVIHNGITPGPTTTEKIRSESRERLQLPQDTFTLGTVARLDPVKDLTTMIRAFALVSAHTTDTRLVIVGDGGEKERLQGIARDEGVERLVVFTGQRNDVRSLIPAFDVFLNSSVTEGISVTMLEAMAASKPIIATRVGGTPELVVDKKTGILAPSRSPEKFAKAIFELMGNPGTRSAMGDEGRRRIETVFSLDTMMQRYMDIYSATSRVVR